MNIVDSTEKGVMQRSSCGIIFANNWIVHGRNPKMQELHEYKLEGWSRFQLNPPDFHWTHCFIHYTGCTLDWLIGWSSL